MEIVLCAIAKNENNYINEWCNHYISLGFDKIYLYDNNDSTTENVKKFISSKLQDKVIVININDISEQKLQQKCYLDFYNKYNSTFDWCAFFDIDEFLTGITNIHDLLDNSKFNDIEQIRVKWNLFGDDDLIERDITKPVFGGFTHLLDNIDGFSNQGKAFIRGSIKNLGLQSAHHAFKYVNKKKTLLKTCLPSGTIIDPAENDYLIRADYSKETVFLNHYMTKSLSEFIAQKINRGDVKYKDKEIDLNYFWQINTKTPAKLNFISYYLQNIDLVVPYVDATDKSWQQVFLKAKKVDNGDNTALNRFRSQGDFFRYFFRSVAKNMPWIHNVFLLVMSESQIPDWIDRSKVEIITHEQFIPKEYLPTFNSGTIEMFLQNIPGLSEHFIYANDDMYALRELTPKHFFNGKKVCFNLVSDTEVGRNDWRQMCQNNHDLIFNTKHAILFLRLDHEFRPYLKSKMQECYKLYEKPIKESISQFREKKNLTVYLFSLYYVKNKIQEPTALKISYTCSTTSVRNLLDKLDQSDTICLNDTSTSINVYDLPAVRTYFYTHFTAKCKYEAYDTAALAAIPATKEKQDIRADGRPNAFLYF